MQKAIRFLGADLVALGVILVAGRYPASSSALIATKFAPEKLRRTCQREKIGAGKAEDAGGLTPGKDDNDGSADFSRWQAYRLLHIEGLQERFINE